MATDGILEKIAYTGVEVSLCLKNSLRRSDSIFYKGAVRGWPEAPFARQGTGWMHFPAQPRPDRPSSILHGNWWRDGFTSNNSPLVASVDGRISILSRANECRCCLSVFDASKSHECPSDRHNPGSAQRHPQRGSASLRPARDATSTSTPSPRDQGTSQSEQGDSDRDFSDVSQVVGYRDGVASAFVLQRLSFFDGRRLGGGKGARSFAAYDSRNRGRSVCFAAACRNIISCSKRDTCPHIEAVRDAFRAKGGRVPAGLPLDGFLALSCEEPAFLPPRRCTAEHCVQKTEEERQRGKTKAEETAPSGTKPKSEQGKRDHSAVRGNSVSDGADGEHTDDTEGEHTESLSDDSEHGRGSDTEASEASTAKTHNLSIVYGYTPPIAEIVQMTRTQLKAVSNELSLDTATTEIMKYNLAEYFHPNDLANLPQELHRHHQASLKGGVHKRGAKRKKKKLRATAGVVGREPDADAAQRDRAFKYAQRARRCVRGSMCTEHALQKQCAVDFLEQLESAEDDGDNIPDVPTDDAGVERGTNRAEAHDTSDLQEASSKVDDDDMPHEAMAWARKPREPPSADACSCSDSRCVAASACVHTPAGPTTGRPSRAAAELARKQPSFRAELLPAKAIESMHNSGGCSECSAAPSPKKAEVPSGAGCEVPISAHRGNTHTRLYLTPTQVEDFLYAISLAKAQAAAPVIPIAKNLYAVLRTEPDECSYSCPGGYSLVRAELSADPLRPEQGGTILSLACTCSEYRSCRTGMGGRSKKGSKKFCTCCLMVVAANVLDAPLERVKEGDSAWLLASRRHEQVSSQFHATNPCNAVCDTHTHTHTHTHTQHSAAHAQTHAHTHACTSTHGCRFSIFPLQKPNP